MKKKTTQKAILFCYVYLYLIIVHWHPVLYVLTFIFSAASLGLEPVSSHSGGSSPPHSPFLPPQVFLFIQAAPQGSYLIQILLPVGLTQPCTPLRWHSWNHLWGGEPRNQTQLHIPCPGSEPPSHTENIPRKNLDLLQARSLLSAVPAPSPAQRWFWIPGPDSSPTLVAHSAQHPRRNRRAEGGEGAVCALPSQLPHSPQIPQAIIPKFVMFCLLWWFKVCQKMSERPRGQGLPDDWGFSFTWPSWSWFWAPDSAAFSSDRGRLAADSWGSLGHSGIF